MTEGEWNEMKVISVLMCHLSWVNGCAGLWLGLVRSPHLTSQLTHIHSIHQSVADKFFSLFTSEIKSGNAILDCHLVQSTLNTRKQSYQHLIKLNSIPQHNKKGKFSQPFLPLVTAIPLGPWRKTTTTLDFMAWCGGRQLLLLTSLKYLCVFTPTRWPVDLAFKQS